MSISMEHLSRIFTDKYESPDSDWVGNSGPGSDPFYNLAYRSFLESFLRLNHIGSIVDIGCGDWQFSRFINFNGAKYLGLDIVDTLVKRNQKLFGSEDTRFANMPAEFDAIPSAHLLIMKDVLQHLPNAEIIRMREFLFPRFQFCLLTNSFRKLDVPTNVDIEYGAFRCLDLRGPPYDINGAYVLQFSTAVWEELRTMLYMP